MSEELSKLQWNLNTIKFDFSDPEIVAVDANVTYVSFPKAISQGTVDDYIRASITLTYKDKFKGKIPIIKIVGNLGIKIHQ